MKRGANLPDADHIVRHVPPPRLRKDENGNVVGINGSAFHLRIGETGLSVNWLEFTTGSKQEQLRGALRAMRGGLTIPHNHRIAVGNVGAVHSACIDAGHRVRIVFAPTARNPGHAELRQFPDADYQLFELLAQEAFAEAHRVGDLDASPKP